MLKEKRFVFLFFAKQVCLIIPVFVVSVLITGIISERMQQVEETKVEQQLNNASNEFYNSYIGYYNEFIILSERRELRPDRMLSNAVNAYYGIELLNLKKSFDNRISSILVEYGTKHVYSDGLYSKRVYFESHGYREESIVRAIEAMERGEEGITVLFKDDFHGSFMLTYAMRYGENQRMSVNYILSFEQVMLIFRPFDSSQWFVIETKDGSILALGCDEEGDTIVLDPNEYEQRLIKQNYQVYESDFERAGIKIKLFHEKKMWGLSKEFYQMQWLNMILILWGGILSGALSWRLSWKRMKEIIRLENIALGDDSNYFTERDVYNRLQNIIVCNRDKTEELERKEIANKIRIKEKIVNMIFHGYISDIEELEIAFKEVGWKKGDSNCYFIGVISVKGQLLDSQLPSVVKDCLMMYVSKDNPNIIAFLFELQVQDKEQIHRMQIADEIKKCLNAQQISRVYIGMSRIYTDISLIGTAFNEAMQVLNKICNEHGNAYCGCGERLASISELILPDYSSLHKFEESLENQNVKEALQWLHRIIQTSLKMECSRENRRYIRYTVLHCVVEYLNRTNVVGNGIFLAECLQLDVGDGVSFEKNVTDIIKKCIGTQESNGFRLMLEYIENNYYRSDLSYEEVALVGKVSKSYVSRIFKNRLGMSYIEYLTHVRLEHACVLLRTTDESINDIVKLIGYEDSSSFRRSFKNKYGINAAEYRKREQNV